MNLGESERSTRCKVDLVGEGHVGMVGRDVEIHGDCGVGCYCG